MRAAKLTCSATLALLAGSACAVTPVEKVISLLEGLKSEVEAEGKAESATYDKFSCFCKDTTAAKSTAITDGQDTIDTLSASIAADTATKEAKATDLGKRKQKHEELAKELDEAVARWAKERAEYEIQLADVTKAINSMDKAIKALTGAKPAFLQRDVFADASASVALGEALGFHVKQPALKAFLQQGVDPNDPAYKFKSAGIIEVLQKMDGEFKQTKTETQTAFDTAKQAASALKTSLSDEMQANSDAMDVLKLDIEALVSKIAEDREALVSAEATLKDDQLYLKDLTVRCESAAVGWDQRSASRAGELKALSKALVVLKTGSGGQKGVQELDGVNKRALIQHNASAVVPQPAKEAVHSFLQLHRSQHLAKNAVDNSHERAVKFLAEQGRQLGSNTLSALATQVSRDPFAKVKDLVQQLIERLLNEATQEATKKGFCDTELGKAKTDRDHRHAESQRLAAEISVLEAKHDELNMVIDSIKENLPKLRQALVDAEAQRSDEKQDNLAAVKTAREGAAAVAEAIAVLKVYYGQAQKAKVLLQASPVDEDTSGPGFDSPYKGKQSGAGGIVGLLEVIKSDFERTVSQTSQAEKDAQAKFVDFEQVSKSDIAGKEMTQTLSEEDLQKTISATEQKKTDLQTAQGLIDSALKAIEDLKPMCIDTGMSYSDRVAKREEEIKALKGALCMLDTDGVEAECK